MENNEPNLRATIVLKKPLKRVDFTSKRWFCDGKQIWADNVRELLEKDGHRIEHLFTPERKMPREYKGIKFRIHCGGLVLEPSEDDYMKLVDLLDKDGYFLRDCSLPKI